MTSYSIRVLAEFRSTGAPAEPKCNQFFPLKVAALNEKYPNRKVSDKHEVHVTTTLLKCFQIFPGRIAKFGGHSLNGFEDIQL